MNDLDILKYAGFTVSTSIVATKGKDGKWKVKQTLTQGRLEDPDKEWETKEVEMNAVDSDLKRAMNESTLSIGAYLDLVEGDLFNEDKLESGEVQ